jgi:hypothetical protein
MKWSIKLGQLLGIDVYLHFTFLLLLAFLGFTYWRATQNVAATLQGVAFVVALLAMIALHLRVKRLRPTQHDWKDVLKASA